MWGGGKKQSMDEEYREKRWGPYSLPDEDNGDPQSVYVENDGRKYRLPMLADFKRFRDHALSDEGFTERHRAPGIVVFDKPPPPGSAQAEAGAKFVKVINVFKKVSPQSLYDSLHDPEFRKTWDTNMLDGHLICQLDPRTDIGYYAANFPWPLANREFVNMRCWMEFTNGEFIIFNRTVPHESYPITSKFVRAVSYVSGYYVSPLEGTDKDKPGCRMIYYTASSIQGNIPSNLINFALTKGAPGLMTKLEGNAERYVEWAREQGRDATYVPSWHTPAVSWDGSPSPVASSSAAVSPSSASAAAASATGGDNNNNNAEEGGGGVDGSASGQQKSEGQVAGRAESVKSTDELAKSSSGQQQQQGGGGGGSDSALHAQIAELKRRLRAAEANSLLSGEGSSLAPAASRKDDDPESVQQFHAMIADALSFVDKQYLLEGRAPSSVKEYVLRLHSVVDGIRRTLREERVVRT